MLLLPFLAVVFLINGPLLRRAAAWRGFTQLRFGLLALTIAFVGWWGQGQLSMVTVMASVRAAFGAGRLDVLLYDPFSLAIWAATLVGFVLWGRGLFCGWLCPFGAMQEFSAALGRKLGLRQFEPNALFWLGLSMVTFKGFCRYLCPLGAVMAIGGAFRLRNWIERRAPDMARRCNGGRGTH